MTKKHTILFALAALATAVVVGCSREEPETGAQPPAAGNASGGSAETRMADPVYRGRLRRHAVRRDRLLAQYARMTARMEEILAAKRAELGTEDEAALKAALDADPEWKSLYQRCLDLDAAVGDEQRRARETVRQRISK